MALIEATTVSAMPQGETAHRDVGSRVVRLWGEHDLTTIASMAAALSRAIAVDDADDADVVLDLSGVTFMDASTVTVILRTRNYLRDRSRSLRVRSPSRCARLVLETCRLDALVEESARDLAVVTAPPGRPGPRVVARTSEQRPVAPSSNVNG